MSNDHIQLLAPYKILLLKAYRNKNFLQFMTSHKPQALMILMLIIFGGMSFTYTYFGKNWCLLHSTLTSALILLTFFIGSHAGDFIRYNKGMEAYNNMYKPDSILVKDIKTYVSNYSAYGVGFKDKMLVNKNSNFKFTEYFFNKSDLLLSEGSALLFGYGERFMVTSGCAINNWTVS